MCKFRRIWNFRRNLPAQITLGPKTIEQELEKKSVSFKFLQCNNFMEKISEFFIKLGPISRPSCMTFNVQTISPGLYAKKSKLHANMHNFINRKGSMLWFFKKHWNFILGFILKCHSILRLNTTVTSWRKSENVHPLVFEEA